jgi:hypothetical protein
MDFRQSTGGKEDISVLIKKKKKALGVVMTFNRYFISVIDCHDDIFKKYNYKRLDFLIYNIHCDMQTCI